MKKISKDLLVESEYNLKTLNAEKDKAEISIDVDNYDKNFLKYLLGIMESE